MLAICTFLIPLLFRIHGYYFYGSLIQWNETQCNTMFSKTHVNTGYYWSQRNMCKIAMMLYSTGSRFMMARML